MAVRHGDWSDPLEYPELQDDRRFGWAMLAIGLSVILLIGGGLACVIVVAYQHIIGRVG